MPEGLTPLERELLECLKPLANFYDRFVRGGPGTSFAAWCSEAAKLTEHAREAIRRAESREQPADTSERK